MSKSNPTPRPNATNYEVRDGIIYRYEPMAIAEAVRLLADNNCEPVEGLAFCDHYDQPDWIESALIGYNPNSDCSFISEAMDASQCARITAEDPRKVPEGVPELPEPWLAYIGTECKLPIFHDEIPDSPYWAFFSPGISSKWIPQVSGNVKAPGLFYAIDVRTAFAREHFPEYVEALGYPMEEPKPDRIQLTDTQLLDKLAETEYTLPDGRQFWEVFTDRGDPQMTVREAIEAWGADE